jgi:hypothetical protein
VLRAFAKQNFFVSQRNLRSDSEPLRKTAGHQYASYGRFVYKSVYAAEVMQIENPGIQISKVRLVDATANGNHTEIESNWLSLDKAIRRTIDSNRWERTA